MSRTERYPFASLVSAFCAGALVLSVPAAITEGDALGAASLAAASVEFIHLALKGKL